MKQQPTDAEMSAAVDAGMSKLFKERNDALITLRVSMARIAQAALRNDTQRDDGEGIREALGYLCLTPDSQYADIFVTAKVSDRGWNALAEQIAYFAERA